MPEGEHWPTDGVGPDAESEEKAVWKEVVTLLTHFLRVATDALDRAATREQQGSTLMHQTNPPGPIHGGAFDGETWISFDEWGRRHARDTELEELDEDMSAE